MRQAFCLPINSAGRPVSIIRFAIVNVFPDPVTPSNVWYANWSDNPSEITETVFSVLQKRQTLIVFSNAFVTMLNSQYLFFKANSVILANS